VAKAGYVTVTEDSHGSWKQWHILAINHDALSNQISNDCFSGGDSDCLDCH
jgi:hypothetical protein